MMRRAGMLLLGALGSWSVQGCSDAPLTVTGGEGLFDAGPPPAVSDAAVVSLPAQCQTGGASAGSTFADLYACYFGPMGVASCTAFSNCHVSGGVGASFWVCGTTEASCQMGMTGGNGSPLTIVPSGGTTDWTNTQLYNGIHKSDGSGNMPATMDLASTAYTFTSDDLSRIQAWVEHGAAP